MTLTARDNKLRRRNASLPMLAPPQELKAFQGKGFVQMGVHALCAHAPQSRCGTQGGPLATTVFGRRAYSPCIRGGTALP